MDSMAASIPCNKDETSTSSLYVCVYIYTVVVVTCASIVVAATANFREKERESVCVCDSKYTPVYVFVYICVYCDISLVSVQALPPLRWPIFDCEITQLRHANRATNGGTVYNTQVGGDRRCRRRKNCRTTAYIYIYRR